MDNNLATRIYEAVTIIPKGSVATYSQIAKIAGTSPRVVGNFLHRNKDPKNIPCHRVVNVKGELAKNYAFGGLREQKRKLLREGVKFMGDKAVL